MATEIFSEWMQTKKPNTTCDAARTAAAVLLAAALSGCAPTQWVNIETGSPEGAEAALEACHSLARDEAWQAQWHHNWRPHFYEPYGRYRGWRGPYWHNRPFSDELYFRLQNFCMRSRGFELVEIPE